MIGDIPTRELGILDMPKKTRIVLTKRRRALGMTMQDLSDKAGVRKATIVAYENDPNSVTLDIMVKLANALGLGFRDLFEDYEVDAND